MGQTNPALPRRQTNEKAKRKRNRANKQKNTKSRTKRETANRITTPQPEHKSTGTKHAQKPDKALLATHWTKTRKNKSSIKATHWPRTPQRQHTTPTKRADRHNTGKSKNRRYCTMSSVPTIKREKRQHWNTKTKREKWQTLKSNCHHNVKNEAEQKSLWKKQHSKGEILPYTSTSWPKTLQKRSAHDLNPYQQWHVVHRNTGKKMPA